MSHNKNVLAVAAAISYFQRPFSVETEARELQGHLSVFQQMFDRQDISLKSTSDLVVQVHILMVSRYYQLSNSKEEIIKEQFLFVKFVKAVYKLSKIVIKKQKEISIQTFKVMMWANRSLVKTTYNKREENTDLKVILLQFNVWLVMGAIQRFNFNFKIENIYPQGYSLCSGLIMQQKMSVKQFTLCLQVMQILINHNLALWNCNEQGIFGLECRRRLLEDVKFFINKYHMFQLSYQRRIQEFSAVVLKILPMSEGKGPSLSTLLNLSQPVGGDIKKQLFSHIVLLAQICMIDIPLIKFDRYHQQMICQSYRKLLPVVCKKLLSLQANKQLKIRELNKLVYLFTFVAVTEGDEVFETVVKVIKHLLTIKHSHQLISIPNHATTVPIDALTSSHSLSNYPIKALYPQYKSQFNRMLVEVVPFYQLEPDLVSLVEHFFSKLTPSNFNVLLRFFCDELLKLDYQVNMSLTRLYQYLQVLFVIRFLLNSSIQIKDISVVASVFITLGDRTQSVKSLKAAYVEEEIMIAMTLQIAFQCFKVLEVGYRDGGIGGRIKLSQNSVLLLQKVLNQLSEQSYIIRLITTYILLQFSQQHTLCQALRPFQATIIQRNKNNLSLVYNLLGLAELLPSDCQQLADYYMQYRGSEVILRALVVRVSVERARKCVLTVEKWWLLLTREVIKCLNCKEMDTTKDKQDNFASNDGDNVSIKNALGVIIIELGEKWVFYLRSQKRESVVDILIDLLQVNNKMVFFKSGFSKVLRELYNILAETLGRQKQKGMLRNDGGEQGKVQFYGRLRFKIYRVLDLIEKQCVGLYEGQLVVQVRELVQQEFDCVKREYLFQNNAQQKPLYELLKRVVSKFQA